MKKLFWFKGQTIIELVLAMGIAAMIFPTLLAGFMNSREGKVQQGMRLQAITLLKEAEEAVRSVRDSGWSNISVNGTYHTVLSSSVWSLAANSATTNGFTQQVVISDVSRNNNGDIVTSGGTVDPSTKQVVVTISWTVPYASSITSTLYLTRTGNIVYLDTNYDRFNLGTKSTVDIATTSGVTDGQVQLGTAGGGGGDWCQPSFAISTVDLPKSGVANAVWAITGPANNGSTVFAGTGDNASGISFAKVDVPGNPPTASTPATFDGYKTNQVFGEPSYAYMATDNNFKEFVIIDLNQYTDSPTNTKYKEIGAINAPGSVNGDSIFVANNKAYVTTSDKKFYIYNIATRSAPVLLNSGGLTLDGEGKKVLVAGNYAYIATNSTTYQLEIVDVSNTAAPSLVGKLNLTSGQTGVDVYVDTSTSTTTRAYLATSQSASYPEFYIVNVSTKSAPTISGLSSYDSSGMSPTGVTITTNNRAILVGTGGTYQYQVINIANESGTLSNCGNLAYATGIRGVSSVLQPSGYAYSYVITGDASSELKIILGGNGGVYTNSGTYESPTYDATYSTAYNRFVASVSAPLNTSLKMQVAVAPAVSNSCNAATFSFVGPNGDTNAFFTVNAASISGAIPFGNYVSNTYQNPGRCFRYKAWFTTSDQKLTPIIYDVTANYSP